MRGMHLPFKDIIPAFALRHTEKPGNRISFTVAAQAAVTDSFRTFISGIARDVDILTVKVVLRLLDNSSPIHLIAASTYQGF